MKKKNNMPLSTVPLWGPRGESESFQREWPGNVTKMDLVEEVGPYDLRLMVRRGKVRGVSGRDGI